MARSIYFDNCIREIRQSVFGRDNRKPIADAIEILKKNCKNPPTEITVSRVAKVDMDVNENVIGSIDIIEHIIQVPPTIYEVSNMSEQLIAARIKDSYYLLEDRLMSDNVTLIVNGDYRYNMNDSGWSETGLDPSSYVEYEKVINYDTYTMVFNP